MSPMIASRITYTLIIFLFALYSGMSYFGAPNPVELGLYSGLGIFFVGVGITIWMASLGRRSLWLLLVMVWLVFNIITVTNWWHYDYFQAYYNYEVVRFGSDVIDGTRAFGALPYKQEALWLVSGTLIVSILIGLLHNRAAFLSRHSFVVMCICVCAALFFFAKVNTSIDRMRKVNTFTLHPWYLHPVQAFFFDSDYAIEGASQSWMFFKALNTPLPDDPSALTNHVSSIEDHHSKKYNVIFIVVESLRASFVGHYGSKDGLTPNFDRLAKQYITAKNFYANTNYTIKGETAILCGIFDHNAKPPIAEYPVEKNLQCLPELLKERGYHTYYFHGNRGRFYNRLEYLPQMGFEHLYFHGDQPNTGKDGRHYMGWGVSDVDMYGIVMEKLLALQKDGAPFFANFMTLSSHFPFSSQWPIPVPFKQTEQFSNDLSKKDLEIYENYRNGIYYDDYALGYFWDAFHKSSLAKNTIVVVTADHGIWSFPENRAGVQNVVQNEHFFRIPLLIYHPDRAEPQVIEQISSQIDIAPTVLGILGIDYAEDVFIGKDIFQPVAKPWSIMMKGGMVFTRVDHEICYVDNLQCAGAHQSCFAQTDPELSSLETNKRCATIEGDLLVDGVLANVRSNHEWIDNAFGLIRYDNFRVFNQSGDAVTHVPDHISRVEFLHQDRMKAFEAKQNQIDSSQDDQ